MTSRVRWETAAAMGASLVALALLARAALHWGSHEFNLVPGIAWGTAALVAAGFGATAAVGLRALAPGRALALFMSLVAVVIAGFVSLWAGNSRVVFAGIVLPALWATGGSLILFSVRAAGIATLEEFDLARRRSTLAGLVRPHQAVWLLKHRVAAWWTVLPLMVAVGVVGEAIAWQYRTAGATQPGHYSTPWWLSIPMLALILATVILALLLGGTALSNVAARSGELESRDRRAISWLLWALLAAMFCLFGAQTLGVLTELPHLDAAPLRLIAEALMVLAPPLGVLGVVFAVVGLGAVDASLALRRTLSVGFTGLVWIGLSALGQEFASRLMSSAAGLPPSASWLIVVATAVALTPLERGIDRRLERRQSAQKVGDDGAGASQPQVRVAAGVEDGASGGTE